jgi:hypothetical protein
MHVADRNCPTLNHRVHAALRTHAMDTTPRPIDAHAMRIEHFAQLGTRMNRTCQ